MIVCVIQTLKLVITLSNYITVDKHRVTIGIPAHRIITKLHDNSRAYQVL